MKEKVKLEFGFGAQPVSEQIKEQNYSLNTEYLNYVDDLQSSLEKLFLSDLITKLTYSSACKKFSKMIDEMVIKPQ